MIWILNELSHPGYNSFLKGAIFKIYTDYVVTIYPTIYFVNKCSYSAIQEHNILTSIESSLDIEQSFLINQ